MTALGKAGTTIVKLRSSERESLFWDGLISRGCFCRGLEEGTGSGFMGRVVAGHVWLGAGLGVLHGLAEISTYCSLLILGVCPVWEKDDERWQTAWGGRWMVDC
jgi:hypothetical protein